MIRGIPVAEKPRGEKARQIREISPNELRELIEELAANGFDHLKSLTGLDRPEKDQIELIYHVSSYSRSNLQEEIIEIRVRIDRDNPKIESISDIWPSSKYIEAETRDLLGVTFEGNEIRSPLILPEELGDEHPLRKDFKIPEEGKR
ncbi:hypothetical protein AKJ57_06715 [candidate division MSBL1 archaeon SCGC-AAA259A05]|uniref:NADH:ubiquinone oxidoreductase 30kDa subunit domain-containing protein n=1 Tax=candidate division MSBL1 archaeon SCGC-AAA259A05 TaxID=1698259 RepID=A0A133U2Z3_9EURY|nr:hypothetical protein AKJ57_06715 [candidate division MSBL1 archaeon SCGC-AAA259A05]